MKKLIAILALMAAGSAYAADVDFVAVDNADGTAQVTWTATGCTVLGMGLEVAVGSEDSLTDVALDGFNVYIDEASDIAKANDGTLPGYTDTNLPKSEPKANLDTAGAVTSFASDFALCAGYLDQNNTGLTGGTIVFTADADSTVQLKENAKRGGVVGIKDGAVASLTTNLGTGMDVDITKVTVPTCPEDLNGSGFVEAGDISMILAKFGQAAPAGTPEDLNGSGFIEAGDISMILAKFGQSTSQCAGN